MREHFREAVSVTEAAIIQEKFCTFVEEHAKPAETSAREIENYHEGEWAIQDTSQLIPVAKLKVRHFNYIPGNDTDVEGAVHEVEIFDNLQGLPNEVLKLVLFSEYGFNFVRGGESTTDSLYSPEFAQVVSTLGNFAARGCLEIIEPSAATNSEA